MSSRDKRAGPPPDDTDADLFDPTFDPEKELGALEIPVDGTLDLHTFAPSEASALLGDYIGACIEKGIFELRVVHGKGTGALRRTVHTCLERDARVESFNLAGASGGSWGATLVRLRRA